jgi:hypothetical protein
MSLTIGKAGRGVDRDELLEIINGGEINVDGTCQRKATEKLCADS